MKKNLIRDIAAFAILLIVYTVAVFAIPFKHTIEFKLAYGFTVASILVFAAACYIAFIQKPDAKSRFYGFPIAKIGFIYFLFQLIAGILMMTVGLYIPKWISILVFIVALGAAALGLISAEAVVSEIHHQDEKLKKDVTLMRSLQSKANQMASMCDDAEISKAIKAFAEELRYSDPVSKEEVADAEAELSSLVDQLQQALVDGDNATILPLCRKASVALSERNRLCKLSK